MEKKKSNKFKTILTILLFIYVMIYILRLTGTNELAVREDVLYTQNQIIAFEEDVRNNVAVDVKDYLPEKTDYSNFFTKSANSVCNGISSLFNDKIHGVFKFVKSLFSF